MPGLREYWESGFRALHIEENIGNAFADFAPYAGADEQRVVVTRQASWATCTSATAAPGAAVGIPLGPASFVSSSTAVVMEENGDFTVQARDASAGSISFSTTGHLQLDAAVRVPLPPPLLRSSSVEENGNFHEPKAHDADAVGKSPTSQQQRQQRNEDIRVAVKPPPSQLRFGDYIRPISPPSPLPRHPTPQRTPSHGPFGQLEVDSTLPDWDAKRQSLGARIGPAAVRLTRTFSAAATATATEAATSRLQDSGSLSDEDELARAARDKRARRYQHTIDAALCIPFGGGGGGDVSSSTTGSAEQAVTRTLSGHRVVLRAAPWALTCGVQFPLEIGDTLIGLSLQNDRAMSVSLPYPGVEWAVSSPASSSSAATDEKATSSGSGANRDDPVRVACVPSPYFSPQTAPSTAANMRASSGTAVDAAPQLPSYVVIPNFTLRLLFVQTLASHTLVRESSPLPSPQRDDSGSTSLDTSGMTRLASSYDWRRLPTLIGVNVGVDRERLRLSAASIVHDGNMDLEVAGVLDMTPWTPRLPTLVKVGYNNVGRFAAGITSLFYETLSATLGVHVARGEQAKFGIEVKF